MITAWVYEERAFKEIPTPAVSELVGVDNRILWVDLVDPTEDDLARVQEEFSLHPLAMEDIRERHQRPKIETYPSHSFVVAYTGQRHELEMFVGVGWLVTVRPEEWETGPVRDRFARVQVDKPTVGFLVYVLLDEIVDGYFTATDEIEESLEQLEESIFSERLSQEEDIQETLFTVRRRLMEFRRVIVPLRDVVQALLRREADWVDDDTATHLQDVYDHVLRAVDVLDSQRELMGNAVDAHLAIISNQVNNVMKRMTSWGAILLGSTLVAGIYGMNFDHMPELHWILGYPFALGLMMTITICGYRYFKARRWL
ncbi:MAG TPA: magnesium/cobalt transporter CorA [Acidimicrobiales bacterium]|nr:magnesium/cobalt transporter CorA [Acidimicrobiales bacterium]